MATNALEENVIVKEDLPKQKLGANSFTSIEFMHESDGGETFIDFNNLIVPSLAIQRENFQNPTPAKLISAGIKGIRGNVELHSSDKGELQRITQFFITENSGIRLTFETKAGEIITGKINNVVKNEPYIVDAQPLIITTTLAEGDTDVHTGKVFRYNANQSTNLGEIVWYREGALQLRNNGNLDDGSRDYFEVFNGTQFSQTVRFNTPAGVGGEEIVGIAYGRLLERPQDSYSQEFETLGGQIDKIVEILDTQLAADVSQVQSSPNQPDLRAFGDLVAQLSNTTGQPNDGVDLGGDTSVFKQKTGFDLEFRGLTAGLGISLTENANDIVIESTSTVNPDQTIYRDTFSNLQTLAATLPDGARAFATDLSVSYEIFGNNLFPLRQVTPVVVTGSAFNLDFERYAYYRWDATANATITYSGLIEGRKLIVVTPPNGSTTYSTILPSGINFYISSEAGSSPRSFQTNAIHYEFKVISGGQVLVTMLGGRAGINV